MRRILASLAVVGALLFSAGSAWADRNIREAELTPGDYYRLGLDYDFGRGVPENDIEAVKWYRKAAEQGHEFAKGFLESFEAK
jgi:TPR repeat protein